MPDVNLVMMETVRRRRPAPVLDGQAVPSRGGRYGSGLVEAVVNSRHLLAEEGSYFTTSNPTPGTALAAPVAAAFADTSAAFLVFNTADVTDPLAPYLFLDQLKLNFTVAPATATGVRLLVRLDHAPRTPTAGSTLLAGDGGIPGAVATGPRLFAPVAKVWGFTGGVLMTIPALTTEARTVALGGIDGIPVVGGSRSFVFGQWGAPATGQGDRCNPVAIPPGWSAALHVWFPGNATTGASLEPELSWWER
jgi:hypothetical protein